MEQDACKVAAYAVLRRFNLFGINDDEIQMAKIISAPDDKNKDHGIVATNDARI